MEKRDLPALVEATGSGQFPFAAVLGCIDSRVPPETVFDQSIGDIFSVRIAGNIVNEDVLASLEYATCFAGARLIVVLGHTSCGAVTAACDGVQGGHLTALLRRLQPAVDAVRSEAVVEESNQADLVERATEMNVRLGVRAIPSRSPMIRERVDGGELMIVGAQYDVRTGKVIVYE